MSYFKVFTRLIFTSMCVVNMGFSFASVSEIPKTNDATEIYGYDIGNNVKWHLDEALRYGAFNQQYAADKEMYFARLLNQNSVAEAKFQQNLGIIALKRKQPKQAFLFFQQAAHLTPGDHDAFAFWLESFRQEIGDKNTEALFLNNYEAHPTNPENVYVLAVFYQEQNRLDEAIQFFKAYIALSPNGLLRQSADNALLDLQTAREALVKSPYSQIR